MLIVNSTAYADSEIDTPNTDFPVVATSCGHHAMITQERFRTIRDGRTDYQLLYAKDCPIHYYIEGKEYISPSNSFLLYHPGQPQYYEYFLRENANIYWVHFTGNAVPQILEHLGLDQGICFESRSNKRYTMVYDMMIEELTSRRPLFLEYTSHLMQELLLNLSRSIVYNMELDHTTIVLMEQALNILNQHYRGNINFTAIASELKMSPSWFSRCFTSYFQMSPQRYLTNIRLGKSKTLLLSDVSMKDIAELCGFPDQTYFSRIFKKYEGMTPTDYRKIHMERFQTPDKSALHSTFDNDRPETHTGD